MTRRARKNSLQENSTTNDDQSTSLKLLLNKKKYQQSHTVRVLEKEDHNGHVEYKREIRNPTFGRMVGLTTQLSFRLDQGDGTAVYMLGVEDDGMHSLNDMSVIEESVRSLTCIAHGLGAEVTKVSYVTLSEDIAAGVEVDDEGKMADLRPYLHTLARAIVHVHHFDVSGKFGIRYNRDSIKQIQVPNNFLLLGPSGAGKSSLIGALVNDDLDNGRGYARCCVLRHRHEFMGGNRGQTSCVGRFWLEREGDTNMHSDNRKQNSHVVLTDTPGKPKYLKQTLAALTLAVDYALLVVDSTQVLHEESHISSEYMLLVKKYLNLVQNFYMNKRVLIVANKTDLLSNAVRQQSYEKLKKTFGGYRCILLSCVSGDNLETLKSALFSVPKRLSRHVDRIDDPFELLVTTSHANVMPGTQILEGYVRSGCIDFSCHNGSVFTESGMQLKIKSCQINRKNVAKLGAGQFCSIGVEPICKAFPVDKPEKEDIQKLSMSTEQIKVITEKPCNRIGQFFCRIQFLEELKKPYLNANVQLIYLNTRYTAKLIITDYSSESSSSLSVSDGSENECDIDMSSWEQLRNCVNNCSLVDCEVFVEGGIPCFSGGARFYVSDFSQILGVGRLMP